MQGVRVIVGLGEFRRLIEQIETGGRSRDGSSLLLLQILAADWVTAQDREDAQHLIARRASRKALRDA